MSTSAARRCTYVLKIGRHHYSEQKESRNQKSIRLRISSVPSDQKVQQQTKRYQRSVSTTSLIALCSCILIHSCATKKTSSISKNAHSYQTATTGENQVIRFPCTNRHHEDPSLQLNPPGHPASLPFRSQCDSRCPLHHIQPPPPQIRLTSPSPAGERAERAQSAWRLDGSPAQSGVGIARVSIPHFPMSFQRQVRELWSNRF